MSDAPTPAGPRAVDRADTGPADETGAEGLIAAFRRALAEPLPPAEVDAGPEIDLLTVVEQFTALRHEVNLQTRATRQALDQMRAAPPVPPEVALKPAIAALIEVADALGRGLAEVEAARERVLERFADAPAESPAPRSWWRVFGTVPAPATDAGELGEWAAKNLAGVADGYQFSLRRAERGLAQLGVTGFDCAGARYDPETMEAVEAVADPDRWPGWWWPRCGGGTG